MENSTAIVIQIIVMAIILAVAGTVIIVVCKDVKSEFEDKGEK